jgi:hypothetical protein
MFARVPHVTHIDLGEKIHVKNIEKMRTRAVDAGISPSTFDHMVTKEYKKAKAQRPVTKARHKRRQLSDTDRDRMITSRAGYKNMRRTNATDRLTSQKITGKYRTQEHQAQRQAQLKRNARREQNRRSSFITSPRSSERKTELKSLFFPTLKSTYKTPGRSTELKSLYFS